MKIISGLLLILLGAALAHFGMPYAKSLKEQSGTGDHRSFSELVSKPFQKNPTDNNSAPETQSLASCIIGASSSYHVPSDVLIGIMYVEGGQIGQEVGPNPNGTYDLGLMQINSLWIPQLAELWEVDNRTAYGWVRDNGCESVYVGAWILKQGIVETGTLHEGIAHYHSSAPGRGAAYAKKVVAVIKQRGLSFPP